MLAGVSSFLQIVRRASQRETDNLTIHIEHPALGNINVAGVIVPTPNAASFSEPVATSSAAAGGPYPDESANSKSFFLHPLPICTTAWASGLPGQNKVPGSCFMVVASTCKFQMSGEKMVNLYHSTTLNSVLNIKNSVPNLYNLGQERSLQYPPQLTPTAVHSAHTSNITRAPLIAGRVPSPRYGPKAVLPPAEVHSHGVPATITPLVLRVWSPTIKSFKYWLCCSLGYGLKAILLKSMKL